MSTNTNPLGPPPWWYEVYHAKRHSFEKYSELWHKQFDGEIAAALGMKQGCVLTIPGLSGVLSQLPFLFPKLNPTGWIKPTFWQFPVSANAAGFECSPLTLGSLDEELSSQTIVDHIRTHHLRSFLLTRPNNPTGHHCALSTLEEIYQACPECLFLVDETYALFEPDWHLTLQHWHSRSSNVVSFVSFSKILHLPGLRAALALTTNDTLSSQMIERFGPIRINPITETAISRLLSDHSVFARTTAYLADEWGRTAPHLAEVSGVWKLERRCALFRWARISTDLSSTGGGNAVRERLRRHGISVLSGADYGTPDYIRFKCGTTSENDTLISALSDLRDI